MAENPLILQFLVQAQVGAVLPVAKLIVYVVADQENGLSQDGFLYVPDAFPVEHHAGGVGGGVQHDCLGSGSDGISQSSPVDLKAGLAHIQMDGFGPGNGGNGFIQAKARGRDDDFLAGIQNPQQRCKQRLTGPDGNEHLIRGDGIAPTGLKGGHGFP